jgi:PAS domain-containing protein
MSFACASLARSSCRTDVSLRQQTPEKLAFGSGFELLNRPNSRQDGANMTELAQNAEGELSDAFEKLVQEAARLQTVIDTVPSFLWTSLPDGSKEYLNKRWYEYTGLSLEEGKGWGLEGGCSPR